MPSQPSSNERVLRHARLPLPVDLPALSADLFAAPDRWRPHFQTAYHDGRWTALPLRVPEGVHDETLAFAPGDGRGGYRDTPLLAACPGIAAFVATLRCPVLSVRLLKLAAGAALDPHRDADLAYEHGEARLHVPIATHPDVEFVIDGERVVMEPGTCWYINANLTHHVANRSPVDRVHLVADVVVDDWLRDVFARAEVTWSRVYRDARVTRQMIEELRRMDAPAARELVAALEAELAAGEGGEA